MTLEVIDLLSARKCDCGAGQPCRGAGDVGAVGMLARCEIRRRWRSVVVLTLLVGVVGAVVLATAAGARRSDSALDRFNESSRSSNVDLSAGDPTPAQLNAFRGVHGVAAMAVLRAYALFPRGAPNLAIAAAVDSKLGSVVDRSRLVAGRRADPAAAEEITIGEALAAQLHLGLGGHLDVDSISPAQLEAARAGVDAGPPAGPRLRLRIVGIVRRPGDLGDSAAAGGVVILTPAFNRAYSSRIALFTVALRVRTRDGAADVPRVIAAARRIFGRQRAFDVHSITVETEGARNAIDVLTLALWIFAGVAALAGFVAIGIMLTREISLVSVDQATLRGLGLTRRQRVAMSGPGALLIAGGGALLAALGAAAASPLFPIGVARRAEPHPGLHIDWVVLTLGVIAVAALVLLIAFLAAVRTTRRASREAAAGARRRGSASVEIAARSGLAPTVTNGLRMALQAGNGETAVPVRSAFLGAVFGVFGVTVIIMFASNLNHLVATPRLYGWTWDLTTKDATSFRCRRDEFGLLREPGVAAVAAACYQNVQIDGRPVIGWGFTSLRGTIAPEVVAGRAPRGPREVALGSVTLHALAKNIGDTVHVRGPNATHDYRIVGRIVLPRLADPQPLADGAAFTGKGLSRVLDPNNVNRYLLVRFAPGVDRAAVEHRIAAIPQLGSPTGPAVPVEVDRLRQIGWFPVTLATLLAGLAVLALAHAFVTGVRRRRRELALLKTLGFDRRQVRATVAWQATTLATVSLVVGIPAGLIVGRLVWHLVADGLGVSTTAIIPTLALLLLIPAVLVLVNLIAFFPARTAAQTRPAVALRSE